MLLDRLLLPREPDFEGNFGPIFQIYERVVYDWDSIGTESSGIQAIFLTAIQHPLYCWNINDENEKTLIVTATKLDGGYYAIAHGLNIAVD